MPHLSLDAIVERLSEQLQCEQEDLCLSILHQVSRGKPLSKAILSTSLQISQNELEQRLARLPDTEFDHEGNIVGWGVTLVSTRHRFQMDGRYSLPGVPLIRYCFPPLWDRQRRYIRRVQSQNIPLPLWPLPKEWSKICPRPTVSCRSSSRPITMNVSAPRSVSTPSFSILSKQPQAIWLLIQKRCSFPSRKRQPWERALPLPVS